MSRAGRRRSRIQRLRRKSNSIAAPWLAHAAYNSVAYLAARQAWRMQPTDADALDGRSPIGRSR